MAITRKYCGKCERILEDEDGEIKKDANGNERCPVCGEKLCDELEADKIFTKIEKDLEQESSTEHKKSNAQ